MDLILASMLTLVSTLAGAFLLARVRGVASRAEGRMERVLDGIPDVSDRERWREELRRTLQEFDGRPLRQFRESKQLVRAAERLVEVYTPSPGRLGAAPEAEPQVTRRGRDSNSSEWGKPQGSQGGTADLSYRERRILELRYGLGGERKYSAKEVGEKFNVYADRIEQIESQALRKVQQLIEAEKLREIR